MTKQKPTSESVKPITSNAWTVILGDNDSLDGLWVTLVRKSTSVDSVQEGDVLTLLQERSDAYEVVAFARVFRIHKSIRNVTFYFDGILPLESAKEISELGFSKDQTESPVERLGWPTFESALKKACGIQFNDFPVLKGDTSKEQAYIRDLLQSAVENDLLGPANGPYEEIIGMSVRDRYLVGKLAPKTIGPGEEIERPGKTTEEEESEEKPYEGHHQPGAEFPSASGDDEIDEIETEESDASKNQSLVPSSMGFTFCVDSSVKSIELTASWGRYERTESERINEKTEKPFRCWKRIPSGGTHVFSLQKSTIKTVIIDKECPEVFVKGTVGAPLENGDRLVTLFLVNDQIKPEQLQDRAWLFQPEMIVRDKDNRAIFQRRPLLQSMGSDTERESLEMIYRHQVEFAVGHGVSVHGKCSADDTRRAVEVKTRVLPQFEIPVTETPGLVEADRSAMRKLVVDGLLDMKLLAKLEKPKLIETLNILVEDYSSWIVDQRARIEKDLPEFKEAANEAMNRCETIQGRLREGIAVLESDDKALEAFRFANTAMADQRIHGSLPSESEEAKNLRLRKSISQRTGRGVLSSWPSSFFLSLLWQIQNTLIGPRN